MKKLIAYSAVLFFLFPSLTFASTLTQPQVNAIIGLLIAFGVGQSTINIVQAELLPTGTSTPVLQVTPTPPAPPVTTTPSLGSIPTPSVTPSVTSTVTSCDDTPQFTVTPFTLDSSNVPTILNSLSIPFYDPISQASVNQQIQSLNDQIQAVRGQFGGTASDEANKIAQLQSQINFLRGTVHTIAVLFDVSVKSGCPDSHWLVDEQNASGVYIKRNSPSDDYVTNGYQDGAEYYRDGTLNGTWSNPFFVQAFNGYYSPKDSDMGQVIPLVFTAHDGVTTGSVTTQVTVSP